MDSGDLPDGHTLEMLYFQLLWSTAALGSLAKSAPMAARIASLKGLPQALLSALKCKQLDVYLFAGTHHLWVLLTPHTHTCSL